MDSNYEAASRSRERMWLTPLCIHGTIFMSSWSQMSFDLASGNVSVVPGWKSGSKEMHGEGHYVTSGICLIAFVALVDWIEKVFMNGRQFGKAGFIVVCLKPMAFVTESSKAWWCSDGVSATMLGQIFVIHHINFWSKEEDGLSNLHELQNKKAWMPYLWSGEVTEWPKYLGLYSSSPL